MPILYFSPVVFRMPALQKDEKITTTTYFFVRVSEQKHEKPVLKTTKLTVFCRHIKGVSSNIVIFHLLNMCFALIYAQIISYKKV